MQITKPVPPPLIIVSDVVPKDIDWLWYPYIPMHSASLIFGPGGHGKSHITVDLAAKWTTGRPLPGQSEGLKPQKVLMLSAEDDLERVLTPRLIRAGADLTKIAVPKVPFTLDAKGLEFLKGYIHQFSATIVFIDPLVTYLGPKVDLNKANETRVFTGGLGELAKEYNSSVIIVGHSRKTRTDDSSADYERAMGSADFNNSVRSSMFVTKASDGTHVMRHAKTNWGVFGETLAFELGENGLTWLGAIDEDGAVSDKPLTAMARRRNKIEEWLKRELQDGPVRASTIESLAKQAGFSSRTLQRAKPYVAESYMMHVDGKPVWYWRLIEKETEDEKELPVQDVDEVRDRPETKRGRASHPTKRRSGAGRRVHRGEGRATGKADWELGDGGLGGREENVPLRGKTEEGLSNRERARQLLAAMGEK